MIKFIKTYRAEDKINLAILLLRLYCSILPISLKSDTMSYAQDLE